MIISPSDSTLHKTQKLSTVKINRWSELMSQNVKILDVVEDWLFTEGMETSTIYFIGMSEAWIRVLCISGTPYFNKDYRYCKY